MLYFEVCATSRDFPKVLATYSLASSARNNAGGTGSVGGVARKQSRHRSNQRGPWSGS